MGEGTKGTSRWRHKAGIGLIIGFFMALILAPLSGGEGGGSSGELGTSNGQLTVDGEPITSAMRGVVDTTALQYALLAFAQEEEQYAGMNQNFPWPAGTIPATSLDQYWDRYFDFCRSYDLGLVRLGAADLWGTAIMHKAWSIDPSGYYRVIGSMAEAAADDGVFVVLVLAGTQDYPPYSFGRSGDPFDTTSPAYSVYIDYALDNLAWARGMSGIGVVDLWNEPDCDLADEKHWKGNKAAFHEWSVAVALDTRVSNAPLRTMGVAGQGTLFGWGKSDFDLATGAVPFEVASRHYYAASEEEYLSSEPERWSRESGKPLLWGELAHNKHYPQRRWMAAEERIEGNGGQAICSMTLIGTPGYDGLADRLWYGYCGLVYGAAPALGDALAPLDSLMSGALGASWHLFLAGAGLAAVISGSMRGTRWMVYAGVLTIGMYILLWLSKI